MRMTSSFKSKEPKIGIYRDIDKRSGEERLNFSTGKVSTKYQIKLNDEILDPEELRKM